MQTGAESLRLDKFLFQTRFFKTRTLAVEVILAGKVRINGQRTRKASAPVHVGDGLTFAQGDAIRVIRVTGLPVRRGPASEAQTLYVDLDAPDVVPRG